MTNDEINRKISEAREPSESLPYGELIDAEYQQCDLSPSDSWMLTMQLSKTTVMHVLDWEPRDWTGSEEASAVLLEEMSKDEQYCCVKVQRDVHGKVWDCLLIRTEHDEHDEHKPEIIMVRKDRRVAIACAWLQWRALA